MKKRIFSGLMMLLMVVTLTGCVKFNASMNIKKDKSMDFNIIYAFDTTYFGDTELIDEEDKAKMKAQGFTVGDYADGTMKGLNLSKSINNIDLVSTEADTEFDLSGMMDSDSSNDTSNYIFKVKKGLFKNIYTAKILFDSGDSSLSDSSDEEEEEDFTFDDTTKSDDSIFDDTTESDSDMYFNEEESEETEDSNSSFDFGNMTSSLDLSFNVTLPYKAISNNATTVSEEGKKLTWTLTSSDASSMEFEFELYNMTNIYVCIGVAILIIVIIVIVLRNKKNSGNVINTATISGVQPSPSDMTQNIGKDVYQDSLQRVATPVQPVNVAPTVEPVASAPVQPVNVAPTVEPVASAPVQPVNVAPTVEPVASAPVQPVSVIPAEVMNEVSGMPQSQQSIPVQESLNTENNLNNQNQ